MIETRTTTVPKIQQSKVGEKERGLMVTVLKAQCELEGKNGGFVLLVHTNRDLMGSSSECK